VEAYEGTITFGGEQLQGVPPHQRGFGMVFQNYALFPHLTVEGNVTFGLEARKIAAEEARRRVAEALGMVGLTGYEKRKPGELSGGQQQRVALARALVIEPRVLLLDEPLSNLDAKLRWEMRSEIRRIHLQTHRTALYVTHDQKEALSIADRLGILRDGRMEAIGTPRDLYWNPPTRFTAEFLGEINALSGEVSDAGARRVKTALGEVEIPAEARWDGALKSGACATTFCRPEAVCLSSHGMLPPGFQELTGQARVAGSAFLGEHTLYELDWPDGTRWSVFHREMGGAGYPDHTPVKVAVAANAWRMLP
jgi:ABC-type Fe3+/spermidine/putrescine transport system ATPase subunit